MEALEIVGEAGGTATDIESFVAAYRRSLPVVYGYLLRATGRDATLAEDLTGEVYEAALVAWQQGRWDLADPWLLRVARNKLIDAFRRREVESRKLALVHASEDDTVVDDVLVVDRDHLLACARGLPPLQRAALALRYVEDLPIATIACELDRDVSAVDSLLRRARANLRRMITEGADE